MQSQERGGKGDVGLGEDRPDRTNEERDQPAGKHHRCKRRTWDFSVFSIHFVLLLFRLAITG